MIDFRNYFFFKIFIYILIFVNFLGVELILVDKIVDIKVCVIVVKLGVCFCDMEIDI